MTTAARPSFPVRVRITEQHTLTRVIEFDFDDVPESEVRPRRTLLPSPPRRAITAGGSR